MKPQNPQQPVSHYVHLSQVVTETDLVASSNQLETALSNGQYQEYCALKIANSKDSKEEEIWNFLKVGNLMRQEQNINSCWQRMVQLRFHGVQDLIFGKMKPSYNTQHSM